MTDEMLDLVSEHDEVIEQLPRLQVYAQKLSNFRVVNAFLINQHGQLWIPRRTATKKLFPLCLDASMGGHVMSGESYDQAFKRELKEELNLDADTVSYSMIGKLTPTQHDTSAFMQVYSIYTDQTPQYNSQDFCEYFWLTPEECIKQLNSGDQSKGDLPKIIKHLFL